jgi:hypothetical protein
MVRLLTLSWRVSRGVTVLVIQNVVLLVISLVARVFDDTVANGVSVWDKPVKFSLSFLAFGPMLVWLFSRVKSTRPVRIGVGILGWSMVAEGSLIFLQAARGRASHFNNATSFDASVYRAMAAGVGIFALAGVIVGFLMARKNLGSDAVALATKIAVPMMTFGAVLGFSMTVPRPGQVEAGGKVIGAHSINGADGGVGLPLLGWSTKIGDLRVAHFIGLHSLQFIPLIAVAFVMLERKGILRRSVRVQRQVTAMFALGYGGLILTAFVQARRDVPVTRIDATTVAMLVLLAVAPMVGGAIRVLRSSDSESPSHPTRRETTGGIGA